MAARLFVSCVMRVMSYVIEECMLQFIVCRCIDGSVVLGFAGVRWMLLTGEGWDDLCGLSLLWALLCCRVQGAWRGGVALIGGGVVFRPMLIILCEVCEGVGVGG